MPNGNNKKLTLSDRRHRRLFAILPGRCSLPKLSELAAQVRRVFVTEQHDNILLPLSLPNQFPRLNITQVIEALLRRSLQIPAELPLQRARTDAALLRQSCRA